MVIVISDNIFHGGLEIELSEDLENLITGISITNQIFRRKVKITSERMKHLTKDKPGMVKLVVCDCCEKLYIEGCINHDDFDIVEDIMES